MKRFSSYWEFVEKQNRKTIIIFSLSTLGILLFSIIAVTLPFRDALLNALFPKPKVIAVAIPPSFVQSAIASISPASSTVSASWSSPTTDGNFLMALLSANSLSAVSMVSEPSGWIKITDKIEGSLHQWVYYFPNAPSQSGQVSFTLSGSAKASITLTEFKDIEKVNPFDTQSTATGSGTISSSNITPNGADEFIIAALSTNASTTFASPSAGFAITAQNATTGGSDASSGLFHYFNSGSSSVSNSVTLNTSSNWIHTLLAFKAAQIQITATPTPAASPTPAPVSTEWTQDAHDAQRTGYSPVEPITPWTLAWTWNGPDATGGTGGHLYDASREARTVTGGGNVYVPAGSQGLYALSKSNGSQAWRFQSTTFNATPAYDSSGYVYAGGINGTLYKINASTGAISGTYVAGSGLNKSVLLVGSFAYIVTDSGELHKVDTSTMIRAWLYTGGSTIATPPSYSASRDAIIYATDDLFVHAVNNSNGTQKWHVKPSPTSITPGDATRPGATFGGSPTGNQFENGWPVVAEQHGIVFIRMQLTHESMTSYPSTGSIFPNDLSTTRTWLQDNPQHKNLFALNLDNGSEKFIPAVGYGSTEDWYGSEAHGVMGSQPVVKIWPDGKEVAYIHFRNGQSNPPDGRWDGHMGEMVLDDTTIAGLPAGDLRFVRMARRNAYGGPGYVDIIDEQNPITLAGDTIFHSHWAAAEAVKITGRDATVGLTYASPIEATKHTPIIRALQACGTQNATTHFTTCGMSYVTDGGRFYDAPGFWGYWNVADPPGWRVGSGNTAGTSYSAGFQARYTYVTNGLMIVQGNGGDILAFTYSGGPTPAPTNTPTPGGATPTPTPLTPTNTPTPTPGTGATTATFSISASTDDANEDGTTFDATSSIVWLGTGASVSASFTGLRFTNVTIPKGATISSARLQVYSSQDQWNQYSFTYNAESVDNSATFSTTSRPSQRTIGTQTVTHSDNVQWLANTTYTMDEIATVIQEVVNRSAWTNGNSLSLILRGTGGAFARKFIQSVNGSALNAPKLVVTYTSTGGTPAPTATLTPTPTPIPTYTLSGNVYIDANQNGIKDGESNYTAGATVTLSTVPVQTRTTDVLGNYSFNAIPAGTYDVSLTTPAGYTATTLNPVSVPLAANSTVNFGIVFAPTPTPGGATPTPTPTSQPATETKFRIGSGTVDTGWVDNLSHQITRTQDNRVYTFSTATNTATSIKALYTVNPGYPNSENDFFGAASNFSNTVVPSFSNGIPPVRIISIDQAYDGNNIIHVLLNDEAGNVKDVPFDITTNAFKGVKTLATGAPIPSMSSGFWMGSGGVSGMFDTTGKLHIAYWASGEQIMYGAYTYNATTDNLTLEVGSSTTVSSAGQNEHPEIAVSPLDDSVTVAWVSRSVSPPAIFTRTRSSSGTWASLPPLRASGTTYDVWTSDAFGKDVDQGPSLLITTNGVKHLIYMEDTFGGDYGRMHYVVNTGSSWVDTPITDTASANFYSHAATLATNSSNEIYVFGHGHPNNSACRSMQEVCSIKKLTTNWEQPKVFAPDPVGSDHLDVSVSSKWSVVGWNRPEVVEVSFFSANSGNYFSVDVWYGRLASAAPVSPTNTPIPSQTVTPQPTNTPTPTATNTPVPTVTPTNTPTPTPVPTYTLSGTLYVDTNGNGVQDLPGEVGYTGGATVTLSTVPVQTRTTNALGTYSFASIPAGSYDVTLTVPAGYTATTTNPVLNLPLSANTTQNFGIVQSTAPQIQNITTLVAPSTKFTKAEWSFDLSKTYANPYYYYDPTDTPASNAGTAGANQSWFGVNGVSVDLNLVSPTGQNIKIPAFWYEDYTRTQSTGFEFLGKKANGRWMARFSPSETGTYTYNITAQDSTGTGTSTNSSFTVTNSSNKGFIHTSTEDPRFMDYDNGQAYVPVGAGRQWWNSSALRSYDFETAFDTFGQNGINLTRVWEGTTSYALGVEGAIPVWIREGFSTLPGGALGIEINTANVRTGMRSAKPAPGQAWYQRLSIAEPNRTHKLIAWIKTDTLSGGNALVAVRSGSGHDGTIIGQLATVTGTTGWTQYSATFTPNNTNVSITFTQTGGTGTMYVDDVAFGPTDGSSNIIYNIVSDEGMERHFDKDIPNNDPEVNPSLPRPLGNYFNQWSSYELDKIIESAQNNGVAIQLCMCRGPWYTWPINPDVANYADTWFLKSYQRNFRYQVGRWGYSPAILSWEFWNETGHVLSGSAQYNFYQTYGAYQTATDPYKHLRTTSQNAQAYSPGLWSSTAMDYSNTHWYLDGHITSLDPDDPATIYRFAWCLQDTRGTSSPYCTGLGLGDGSSWSGGAKPWVWGEIGVGTDGTQGNTGEAGSRFLHNIVWSGLFSPMGTTPIEWWWYQEDATATAAKLASRKAASNFFNTVNYDGSNFIYIMTPNDTPPGYTGETITSSSTTARVYAMRSLDKKNAYLWIQNRNHVWSNIVTPAAISPTITIGNLLNTDTYRIEVWNTKTGAIISTANQTPTGGNISFAVSNLTDDVAVKVESTGGSPTSTPVPTSTTTPTAALTVTPTAGPTSTPTNTPTPTPIPTYTLSGTLYVDTNGNGVQDLPGEVGYTGGATVTLSTVPVQTRTADTSGNYSFITIPAGSYDVTLAVPAGYTATTLNPVSVPLAANSTVNFGIFQMNEPYPRSTYITGITFDTSSKITLAPGSDNWPITWADDDHQYTAFGDGGGFGGADQIGRVSLGVARVEGTADNYKGCNVWATLTSPTCTAPSSTGLFTGKSHGIISIGGVLYLWRMGNGSDSNAFNLQQLYRSSDKGRNWTPASWQFDQTNGGNFFAVTFLQYGRDYADAPDNYVYMYAPEIKQNTNWNVQYPGEIVLMRAPLTVFQDQSILNNNNAFEYFTGLDGNGNPQWSNLINARQPVFQDSVNGVMRTKVNYNKGLNRYILTTQQVNRFQTNNGHIGIFDAPNPWGPWTTVLFENAWTVGIMNSASPKTVTWSFSNKWASLDGKDFVMVYTDADEWATIKGSFTIPTYTLSGTVYVDTNGNGVRDLPGEVGYSNGATVTLSTVPVQTRTADASGNYSFITIPAGSYNVTLTVPAGYTATTTNPVLNLPLSANTTQNFGIAIAPTNTPTPTTSPGSATDWPQLQHDNARTGFTPVNFNIQNIRPRWIWFGSNYILRNQNSEVLAGWDDDLTSREGYSLPMPSTVPFSFAESMQPIIVNNKLFVGDLEAQKVYALNLFDGSTLWEGSNPGGTAWPGVATNEVVVFGSLEGYVTAWNTSTGAQLWQVNTGKSISHSPALVGSTVYVASQNGKVYAINITNGEILWQTDTGAPIQGGIAVSDGKVFLANEELYAIGLNASTSTGQEFGRTKITGQSFRRSWPVVTQGRVIYQTVQLPFVGSEYVMNSVINGSDANFGAEQTTVRNWLAGSGSIYEDLFALDAIDMSKDYIVSNGTVGGVGHHADPPVVMSDGRALTYWPTYFGTVMTCSFGCPSGYEIDLATIDFANGNGVQLRSSGTPVASVETDNTFAFTLANNLLFRRQSFRGTKALHLGTYASYNVSAIYRYNDCGGHQSPLNYAQGQPGCPPSGGDGVEPPAVDIDFSGHVGPAVVPGYVCFTEGFAITCMED